MRDIQILEDYYSSLGSWYADSSCSGFDLDLQIIKDKLEVVLTKLRMGYVDDDLLLLKYDIDDSNVEVLNAIDNIIANYS